jgi:hypothetical protein
MHVGAGAYLLSEEAEPLVGWKIWRVEHDDERTRLRSVLYGSLWAPGRPAVADCKKPLRFRHEAPDPLCDCGIHAGKSLAAWQHYLKVGGDRVFGRALLLGDRVEGSAGWRAAAGYPLEVYVPATLEDAEEIAAGLTVYGVPVEVVGAPVHAEEVLAA